MVLTWANTGTQLQSYMLLINSDKHRVWQGSGHWVVLIRTVTLSDSSPLRLEWRAETAEVTRSSSGRVLPVRTLSLPSAGLT